MKRAFRLTALLIIVMWVYYKCHPELDGYYPPEYFKVDSVPPADTISFDSILITPKESKPIPSLDVNIN